MYWFWVDGEKYIIIPKATTKNLYKEIEQKAQEINGIVKPVQIMQNMVGKVKQSNKINRQLAENK